MGHHIFSKAKRIMATLLLAILIGAFLPALPAQAQGGIGISGSFYRHHFKMLPGESMATPQINIVVFNNYNRDIEVELSASVPEGVSIDLDKQRVTIPANKNLTLPVGLSVGETVVPGEYTIGVSADVVPQAGQGIAIVGSAELRTKLTVFGDAAWVHIKTVTLDGKPFVGKTHLYLKHEGQISPAGYSQTGQLDERVIPGDYVVQVYWEGTEVAIEELSLVADEEKEITLVVQTVFIDGFFATPQYSEGSGKISSARMNYTIKNVYRPLQDVRTTLSVYHKDKLLEELEMFALPTLELGSQDSRYTYIPPQGWKNGVYRFVVNLYAEGDVLYAQSREREMEVKTGLFAYVWAIALVLMALLLILFFLWKRRKCDQCKGKGLIDCSHCRGQGLVEDDTGRSIECIHCNGTGKVKCPKCGEKEKEMISK